MSKSVRIHASTRHALHSVISNGRGRIQALTYFTGIEQFSLIGRVSPNAGEAVRLKFQPLRKLICCSWVLFLRVMDFFFHPNQFLHVVSHFMS
jgi:hypothetical protein